MVPLSRFVSSVMYICKPQSFCSDMTTAGSAFSRKTFKRLHYPVDVIAQCVRWYLAYALSLRNLEEMMAERGISVDHATLHRWVIRLVPVLYRASRRYKRPTSHVPALTYGRNLYKGKRPS